MLFYVLLTIGTVAIAVQGYRTVRSGRMAHRNLRHHLWMLGEFSALLVAAVTIVEARLDFSAAAHPPINTILLAAHYSACGVSMGAFVVALGYFIRLYVTGSRFPRLQRWVAYAPFAALAAAITTGIPVLLQYDGIF